MRKTISNWIFAKRLFFLLLLRNLIFCTSWSSIKSQIHIITILLKQVRLALNDALNFTHDVMCHEFKNTFTLKKRWTRKDISWLLWILGFQFNLAQLSILNSCWAPKVVLHKIIDILVQMEYVMWTKNVHLNIQPKTGWSMWSVSYSSHHIAIL